MGRRNKERIARIKAGLEMPISAKSSYHPPKYIIIHEGQIGRKQRRHNSHIAAVIKRKDEINKQRVERDKLRKVTNFKYVGTV